MLPVSGPCSGSWSFFLSVMSLWDTRNKTTSPFSFLMGTMSRRHQNCVPAEKFKQTQSLHLLHQPVHTMIFTGTGVTWHVIFTSVIFRIYYYIVFYIQQDRDHCEVKAPCVLDFNLPDWEDRLLSSSPQTLFSAVSCNQSADDPAIAEWSTRLCTQLSQVVWAEPYEAQSDREQVSVGAGNSRSCLHVSSLLPLWRTRGSWEASLTD